MVLNHIVWWMDGIWAGGLIYYNGVDVWWHGFCLAYSLMFIGCLSLALSSGVVCCIYIYFCTQSTFDCECTLSPVVLMGETTGLLCGWDLLFFLEKRRDLKDVDLFQTNCLGCLPRCHLGEKLSLYVRTSSTRSWWKVEKLRKGNERGALSLANQFAHLDLPLVPCAFS